MAAYDIDVTADGFRPDWLVADPGDVLFLRGVGLGSRVVTVTVKGEDVLLSPGEHTVSSIPFRSGGKAGPYVLVNKHVEYMFTLMDERGRSIDIGVRNPTPLLPGRDEAGAGLGSDSGLLVGLLP